MFSFSKKPEAFFVEINEETALMARTSSSKAPFVVEDTKEVPAGDEAAVQQAVKDLVGKKGGSGFMHARCGIYPPRRLIRRTSVDLKRVKEPGYFHEVCTQQFRIETDKYTIAVLSAVDGTDYEATKATTQKEVVFVGAHNDELLAAQQHLLALGVFPERLELGTIATLGALADYHAFAELEVFHQPVSDNRQFRHSIFLFFIGADARPAPTWRDPVRRERVPAPLSPAAS